MRIPTVLAALAVAVLAVAGCSSADATDTADAPAASSPATQPGVVLVGADEAVAILDTRDDVTIIDVRTPAEFDAGHLDGAELIDIYEDAFGSEIDALDRDAAYLVYCRTGSRSGQAVAFMETLGFTEVYDAGGLDDLARAGAPTQP